MSRYRFSLLLIIGISLLFPACLRRKVTIAETLPLNAPLPTEELIKRVNTYGEVKTFSAQSGVLVRNYITGVGTEAEQYAEATGLLRFRRPEDIRMRVTFYGAQVADMVSDGQQFRLALYKGKRRFIYGSNLKQYERMEAEEIKETKNEELAQAGGLINMRPQHITDAFLIKQATANDEVFREEVLQEEPDTRPGKKNRRVQKSYYVLYVVEHEAGHPALRRKFWFDRNLPGTPIVRQQTFENGTGRLASDIWYSQWFTVPDTKLIWPSRVIIDRHNDGYRIEVTLEKDSVSINEELPDTAFVLENTERLEEINLDAPRKSSAVTSSKP